MRRYSKRKHPPRSNASLTVTWGGTAINPHELWVHSGIDDKGIRQINHCYILLTELDPGSLQNRVAGSRPNSSVFLLH